MPLRTVLLLLLALSFSNAQTPLTLEQIISKSVDALGGAANFAQVKAVRMKGSIRFGKGDAGPVLVLAQRPSNFRMEVTFGTDQVVQGYDGKTGWQALTGEHPQPAAELSGDTLYHLIDQAANAIGGALLDRKQRGNTAELSGVEDFNGTACYKINVKLWTRDPIAIFIDRSSFLTVGEEFPMDVNGKPSTIQQVVSDYRKFGSILVACRFVTREKGGEESQRLEVDSVEINPALDAAVFHLPAKP